jgi:hypothetical protein
VSKASQKTAPGAAARRRGTVEWKCPRGSDHVWEGPSCRRRPPCPFCANRRVSVTNSLRSRFPKLAAEWHPTKNGELGPDQIVWGSGRRIVWKCRVAPDHVWTTRLVDRTHAGRGCPYCAGQRADRAKNLATEQPDLAREWHPTRNGSVGPEDVLPWSTREVWWRCHAAGHVFQRRVLLRTRGANCPKCKPHRLSETHCLAKSHPKLATQWHPTKNGELTPRGVAPRSNRPVWWKCQKGVDHEWRTSPSSRVGSPRCPFCIGKRTSHTASLAYRFPTLAKQWHPTKNGALTPADVVVGSGRLVYWQCPKSKDHVWRTRVLARTRDGKLAPCPFCARRRVSPSGDNSLARTHPRLAKLWHPTKNGALGPNQILSGSEHRVFWKCPKGPDHEWASIVYSACAHHSCPFCEGRQVSVTNSLEGCFPRLVREWFQARNQLSPSEVLATSKQRYWWRCSLRHAYFASAHERGVLGKGCPVCASR